MNGKDIKWEYDARDSFQGVILLEICLKYILVYYLCSPLFSLKTTKSWRGVWLCPSHRVYLLYLSTLTPTSQFWKVVVGDNYLLFLGFLYFSSFALRWLGIDIGIDSLPQTLSSLYLRLQYSEISVFPSPLSSTLCVCVCFLWDVELANSSESPYQQCAEIDVQLHDCLLRRKW